MDVTPQLIEQIEFAEKFRGYDPDEVDEFLERAGTTIAELSNAVAHARGDAQREAATLIEEASQRAERAEAQLRAALDAPAPAPVASLSAEDEAAQSTRTLMLATRTAEAAIAEARDEGQRLLAESREAADRLLKEAKSEADRLIGESRVSADQMLSAASLRADEEYGSKRNQIVTEIGELEARKTAHAMQIVAVEERLEQYRDALADVHRSLGRIVDNPELMYAQPVVGFDASAHLSALPTAAHRNPQFDPQFDPQSDPAVDTTAQFGSNGIGIDVGAAGDDRESGPLEDAGMLFGEATMLERDDLALPYGGGAVDDGADGNYVNWPEAAPELVPSAPAKDTWGPGSWSALAASEAEEAAGDVGPSELFSATEAFGPGESFDRSDLFSDSFGGFEEPQTAPIPEPASAGSAGQAFRDFPSGGLPVIGQDRYTRDLDQAVNRSEEPKDDAMAAFFEGDDTQQTRRFGRRR